MKFWKENVDKILLFQDKTILKGTGSISHAQVEAKVREIYASYDQKRKVEEAKKADAMDNEELRQLEETLKRQQQ